MAEQADRFQDAGAGDAAEGALSQAVQVEDANGHLAGRGSIGIQLYKDRNELFRRLLPKDRLRHSVIPPDGFGAQWVGIGGKGAWFAVNGTECLRIFDLRTGLPRPVHLPATPLIALSRNADVLVCGGPEEGMRLFKDIRMQAAPLVEGLDSVWALAVSGDGRRVAGAGADGLVQVHNHSGAVEWRHIAYRVRASALALDDRGQRLAVGRTDGAVQVYAQNEVNPVWELETGTVSGWVSAMALDSQGRRLAVRGMDGRVAVYEVGASRPLLVLNDDRFKGWPCHLVFNLAGNHLAVGGRRGVYRIEVGEKGKAVPFVDAVGPVVDFHPLTGGLVTGGAAGEVSFWPERGERPHVNFYPVKEGYLWSAIRQEPQADWDTLFAASDMYLACIRVENGKGEVEAGQTEAYRRRKNRLPELMSVLRGFVRTMASVSGEGRPRALIGEASNGASVVGRRT